MIYQYAVPKALEEYQDMEFRGHVAFTDSSVEILASRIGINTKLEQILHNESEAEKIHCVKQHSRPMPLTPRQHQENDHRPSQVLRTQRQRPGPCYTGRAEVPVHLHKDTSPCNSSHWKKG